MTKQNSASKYREYLCREIRMEDYMNGKTEYLGVLYEEWERVIMTKQNRKQKLADCYTAFKAMRAGEKPKRGGAKDGSIPTKSLIPVLDLLEKDVLSECMVWLRAHGILCDRNNTGFGDIRGTGQKYRYGIKDAGDIIGVLPNGIHYEIECKRGKGGRLSTGQQKRMEDVIASNGIYVIVHGVEELEYYFKGLI